MTTSAGQQTTAAEALRAAEAALAAFDGSELMFEDASPNPAAQARLRELEARRDAARARLEAEQRG